MATRSVATVDSPEFINLQPLEINPLMTKCEIKVFYIGQNRNQTFISKETAMEMAKTLRGAPIVGWYKEDKEDFATHGDIITIDDEGIHFEKKTKPYGFVAPDAEVWFQKFIDIDDFGNEVEHEYLVTTGYLWTKQFPEIQTAINEGRPQSMELDEETMDGHWAVDNNSHIEFFIINDAIFSELCILGEDVEPCFEGSEIYKAQFTKQDNNFQYFSTSLHDMIQDFKFALKGEIQMQDKKEQENFANNQESIEEEKKANIEEEDSSSEEENVDSADETDSNEEEEKEDKEIEKKYSLLQNEYSQLQKSYNQLNTKYLALVQFKNQIEDKQKMDLINSFYMLSDEDKADIIKNRTEYSLDDIEAKLSVICVRKRVNFSKEEENKQIYGNMTYNISNSESNTMPAWVSAVINSRKNKNV